MNYLAHSFLSFQYEEIMIGNFIADAIRGKEIDKYNDEVKKGIALHRFIDKFTDHHLLVKHSKSLLSEKYGKYDAVIMDILYDHFLAKNWNTYSSKSLSKHSSLVYESLESYKEILPLKMMQMLPIMKKQNWLVAYGDLEGITESLKGMALRASFDSHMDEAIEDLKKNEEELNKDFQLFFPEIIQECLIFLGK